MPTRSLRPCAQSGCGALVERGRCPEHQRFNDPKRVSDRGIKYPGCDYSSAGWRKLRAQVLSEEPLCMCPAHRGADDAPASDTVDHIRAHQGDLDLFWSRSNLRGLARACHNAKTSRDDSWNRRAEPASQ